MMTIIRPQGARGSPLWLSLVLMAFRPWVQLDMLKVSASAAASSLRAAARMDTIVGFAISTMKSGSG